MRKRMHGMAAAGIVVALVSLLAACSGGNSSSTGSTPGGAGTGTPAGGTPTTTNGTPGTGSVPVAGATTCAGLLPGSTTAAPGGHFPDITFPANTVSLPAELTSSGTGQYFVNVQHFCAPNSTVSAVQAFFAAQLPGHGWQQTPLFPFNGVYWEPCGDAYCWQKDAAPRVIGLDSVKDQGNGNVTFDLRLLRPPAEPNCDPATFPGPYQVFYNSSPNSQYYFELPPLTKIGPVPSTPGAQATIPMCSAGDQTSIEHAMFDSLKRANWTETAETASGFSATHTGTDGRNYQLNIVVDTTKTTNVQNWSLQITIS